MNQCNEDIFDVVDENDRIIAQMERTQVHAQRLLHRASHIWVVNAEGKILFQRRSPNKDMHPNCWTSSVSGHVDAGETYEQAAKREIIEEIGWQKEVQLEELAYEKASEDTELEFIKLYRITAEGPFQFPADEISELSWKTTEQIDQMLDETPDTIAPSFHYLWQKYRHRLA